jgi:hypothetical protein
MNVTPEMMQRIRALQEQRQQPPTRERSNPLPEGDEGLRALRAFSACQIPAEAEKVNGLLQQCMALKTLSEKTEEALGKSVVTILRANRHCEENLQERVVCVFEKDAELSALNTQLQSEYATLTRLQHEIEECGARGEELEKRRWEMTVKTHGLNPEKYSYRINEETGTVYQVDLECTKCKGPEALRNMRQELATALVEPGVAPAKKEA